MQGGSTNARIDAVQEFRQALHHTPEDGECEISQDVTCGWELIYKRLKILEQLDRLEKPMDPKDWTTSRDGGRRKIVREDLRM
jgi:Methylene-tetrahydrofolate reductase C terminal